VSEANHPVAGRCIKAWALKGKAFGACRDHPTVTSLDSGLRRNDEQKEPPEWQP
jgi:hypothetical protein